MFTACFTYRSITTLELCCSCWEMLWSLSLAQAVYTSPFHTVYAYFQTVYAYITKIFKCSLHKSYCSVSPYGIVHQKQTLKFCSLNFGLLDSLFHLSSLQTKKEIQSPAHTVLRRGGHRGTVLGQAPSLEKQPGCGTIVLAAPRSRRQSV